MAGGVDDEAVALLQALIRNRCVSDPARPEGDEAANLEAVAAVLDHPGLVVERAETAPGRTALLARLAGSAGRPGDGKEPDPRAALLLVAHLDIAPVEASRWRHDPFGGELIDGEVWGRGAVYGLAYLATMALAMRRMASAGVVPPVDVVFVALPDRFDHHGAGIRWLVEQRPDALGTWAITEQGGYPVPSPAGLAFAVGTATNGVASYRLVIEQRPAAVAMARWSDTACHRAVEAMTAIGSFTPPPFISSHCREMLEAAGYASVMAPLLDPARTDETIALLPADVAPFLYSQTHPTLGIVGVRTTRAPLEVPGRVEIEVEVGLLPGQDRRTADTLLRDALGPLVDAVGIESCAYDAPTISPRRSPVLDALGAVLVDRDPSAVVVPSLNAVPIPDTTVLRDNGVAAYGIGTYSSRIPAPELGNLPGNDDERLDVESISLLADLWPALIGRLRP